MRFLIVINDAILSLIPQMFDGLATGLRLLGHDASLLISATSGLNNQGTPLFSYDRSTVASVIGLNPESADWTYVSPDSFASAFRKLNAEGGTTIIIDCNAKTQFPDLPRISYITDSIWSQTENIHKNLELGQGFTYVDSTNRAFGNTHCSEWTQQWVPHGGPCHVSKDLSWRAREIDYLFVGNVRNYAALESKVESILPSRKIFCDFREFVKNCSKKLNSYEKLCVAKIELDDDELNGLTLPNMLSCLHYIETMTEAEGRIALLNSFGDNLVYVVGSIDEGISLKRATNLKLVGQLPGAEVNRLIARSKSLFNSLSVFPGGSHERIWQGMSLGTHIVSDISSFLEADFTHGQSISYFESIEDMSDYLRSGIANQNRFFEMAQAAIEIYKSKHTWKNRAEAIVNLAKQLNYD